MTSKLWNICFAIVGIAGFFTIGIALENKTGLQFATTLRIACASICLFLFAKFGSDYPGENWPKIALSLAFVINGCMFFTPLFDRPVSRGEIMLFALPDAVVFLAARTVTYPVTDGHTRAVRQQLILSLILALAFCAIIFFLASVGPYRHDK